MDDELRLALEMEAQLNFNTNNTLKTNSTITYNQIEAEKEKSIISAMEKIDINKTSSKKKKARCNNCNKKIKIMSFDCKCNGLFCSQCRYADSHNCSFDWKNHERNILKKNNPQIVTSKFNKI